MLNCSLRETLRAKTQMQVLKRAHRILHTSSIITTE